MRMSRSNAGMNDGVMSIKAGLSKTKQSFARKTSTGLNPHERNLICCAKMHVKIK